MGAKKQGLTFVEVEHPTQHGLLVEAALVASDDDLKDLRASDWHDGQLRLLTYPSSVVGFIGGEPPVSLSGTPVPVPCAILKGPGGDFEVVPIEAVAA